MNARDELAKVIYDSHRANTQIDLTRDRRLQGSQLAWAGYAADAILAAGYRKPRTITTREEVTALGEGSVVCDSAGDVSEKRGGLWCSYETAPMTDSRLAKYLPATVLHEGA